MNYRVTGGAKGSRKVAFTCQHCTFELESPLEEAGKRYACPTCGHEIIVPGVQELERFRTEDVRRVEANSRESARRQADEKAREDRVLEEAKQRTAREFEAAQAKQAKRAEREARKGSGVPRPVFAGSMIAVLAVAVAVIYVAIVQPLRQELAEDRLRLNELTDTVNRNAEASKRTDDVANTTAAVVRTTAADLESLRQTVNNNADAVNRTTAALARNLAETDSLARNANRHAHTHPRF